MPNYRDRIEIQEPKAEDDWVDHTDADNWKLYAQRKAEVIAATGREFVSGEKVAADISHMVLMYYDSKTKDITPKMRIKTVVDEKILEIETAYPRGNQRREMVCQCKEVV
jgi:SPP1 family predicted phage head-tail adaptor